MGRRRELATIADAAADAAGGHPTVVIVEGPAGTGKTTLVRAALAALPAGFVVDVARADELAVDQPLHVVHQLAPAASGTPFAAGLDLLVALGDRQLAGPVALVIEDLHWADPASRAALLTAVRRLDADRVLVVVTTRPGARDVDDGWTRLRYDTGGCRQLPLGGLGPDDLVDLAGAFGVELDPPSAARLCAHTAGNPLYVRMLLSELSSDQLTAPDGELPAPRSLASTVTARLAAAPRAAVDLVSALAVWGGPTRLVDLGRTVAALDDVGAGTRAGVTGPGSGGAAAALEEALATGLVGWSAHDAGLVSFTHPLLRVAVYDDLSPRRRQSLHRAAATIAPDQPAALAHRVAAADGPDDVLAADLAAWARVVTDPTAAAHALRTAAELATSGDAADAHLLRAVRTLLAGGSTTEAERLRPQVEAAADTPERALVLGLLAWFAGDASAAERLCQDAAERGRGTSVRADALLHLGTVYTTQSRGAPALVTVGAASDEGIVTDDDLPSAWATLALARGQVDGAPRGLDTLDELLATGPQDAGRDLGTTLLRGVLEYYAARPSAAERTMRAAVEQARGSVVLPRAHTVLAQALVMTGGWDEALVHARSAISLLEHDDQVWLLAPAHGVVATVLGARGRWEPAERHVTAARDAAARARTVEAIVHAAMADAAVARARHDPARSIAALELLAHGGDTEITPLTALSWWPPLVGALLEVGDVEGAGDHVDRLRIAAAARGLDLDARIAGLSARVAAARGDRVAAEASFAAAAAGLSADDPLLDRASVHAHHGLVRRSWGDLTGAATELRIARDLLAPVGAEPYLARIEPALDECGIERAAPPAPGHPPLTPREADVVTLVAQGMTNREVAAALYVSTKAVEYHLGNVFGKLGISSRRQLRGWTGAAGSAGAGTSVAQH